MTDHRIGLSVHNIPEVMAGGIDAVRRRAGRRRIAPTSSAAPARGRPADVRPSEVVTRAARYLEAHGVEGARETAEALLLHLLGTSTAPGCTRVRRASTPRPPARTGGRCASAAPARRCSTSPGRQPFRGLNLEVRPGVFVPRPETEVLVDAALQVIGGRSAAAWWSTSGPATGAVGSGPQAGRTGTRALHRWT